MVNITTSGVIAKPITEIIKREDFEYVIETITYVKLWLILFVLIIIKVILIKAIRACKRAYIVHNERIIRQHGGATTQA